MKKFIIIGIALFFLGEAAYLAYDSFFFSPQQTFTVKFKEVPPLIKLAGDVGVYYRGYKVGKATCRKLSEDQKHIIFCIKITYKDLQLPKNIQVILKTQDIFGDRYFDLVYPKNPSPKLLADGDVISGQSVSVYERIDKYLVEELETGKLGMLISNLNFLTGGARSLLEDDSTKIKEGIEGVQGDIGEITGGAAEAVDDLSYITKELRAILSDPQVKKDVREALSYAPKALRNVNELLAAEELRTTLKKAPGLLTSTVTNLESVSRELPQVNRNMDEVNNNLDETNMYLPSVNNNLCTTNSLLYNTNQQLGCLNPKIPVIPQEVIWQADRTLKRYDCIGWALSKTASKNCLFFRFLFGKPGEPFENCVCP